MPFCSNCNGPFFTTHIPDSSVILEKLRWESGPASIPDPEEVVPIIQSTQREIEECEAQIKALESRRGFLRMYANQLQALTSPIRKMPDEILRRIFDNCCTTNTFQFTAGERSAKTTYTLAGDRPAIDISGVCTRWRRITQSFPAIWSRISVVCFELETRRIVDRGEDKPNLLDIFLDRALQHPLTVSIEMDGNYEQYRAVLTRLLNTVDRWYSCTYQSEDCELPCLLSDCNPSLALSTLPLLERLHISEATEEDMDFVAHKAPKLKELNISTVPGSSNSLPLFAQLSHLKFNDPSGHGVDTLLHSSCHLLSLNTEESVRTMTGYYAASMSPTSCGTIHTLTITHTSLPWSSVSIFSYLTLPSLKTIHLEGHMDYKHSVREYDWVNFDPFRAFLSRSSCPLTTLSIESLALADLKLVDLLIQVPLLQHLSIDDTCVLPRKSPITSRFIQNLLVNLPSSLHGGTYLILPRLHSLKLNVGAPTFEDTSIVDMVGSRWIPERRCSVNKASDFPVDCLREFTIRFRNRKEIKGVYQPLEDLEKNGLRAVVLWHTEEE